MGVHSRDYMRDRPLPDDGEPDWRPAAPPARVQPAGRGIVAGALGSGAVGLVTAALGFFVALPEWTALHGARSAAPPTTAEVAALADAAEGVHMLGVLTLALGLVGLVLGVVVGARAGRGLRGYAVALPGALACAAGVALLGSAR